jgi:hypothetical protein
VKVRTALAVPCVSRCLTPWMTMLAPEERNRLAGVRNTQCQWVWIQIQIHAVAEVEEDNVDADVGPEFLISFVAGVSINAFGIFAPLGHVVLSNRGHSLIH